MIPENKSKPIRSGFDNGHIRMYKEATDLLNKININRSPRKAYYFTVNMQYTVICQITPLRPKKRKVCTANKKYRDSSLNFYPIQSRAYNGNISKYIDTGKYNEDLLFTQLFPDYH
jgi:hypothetical protein